MNPMNIYADLEDPPKEIKQIEKYKGTQVHSDLGF